MNLDPGTVAIIQLAWSRRLGLADSALSAAAPGERLYSIREEADTLSFIRLFDTEVFSGPRWAAERAGDLDAADLTRHGALVRLAREHGGRAVGSESLLFTDALPAPEPQEQLAVSSESAHALKLERQCPPDDAMEAGLGGQEELFVLVDDTAGDPEPVAGAAYSIWEGILADVRILTVPRYRRQGLGRYVGAVAVEDAMAAGLVPQWRARLDNVGAARAASGLSFVTCGARSAVRLAA